MAEEIQAVYAHNVTHTHWRAIGLMVALTVFLSPLLSAANGSVRAAPTYTEVGGPIISDTTWTLANSPYTVVTDVEVWQGATLVIEPGVVVGFQDGKLLQIGGTLVARGTESERIVFTSAKVNPAPGDWGNIYFADSSIDAFLDADGTLLGGSVLQYCTVEYGGGGVGGAIETDQASPLIDHCTVRDNGSSGIRAVGISAAPIIIRNNTIDGNSVDGQGGGIRASCSEIVGNTVIGNSASGDHGYGGGIYAAGYSIVISNTVSGNSAEDGGGIYVFYSTVTNNTISGNLANRGGGIYADGSTISGNSVDGNSAQEHGGGIYASFYSRVTGNNISHNRSAYQGGGVYGSFHDVMAGNIIGDNLAIYQGGGIYSYLGTVISNTITLNGIVDSAGQGSGVYFSRSGDFSFNTIVGNTAISPIAMISGVAIWGTPIYGMPQFNNNNLYGNSNYDVMVLSSSAITATNNYWGTISPMDILSHVFDGGDDISLGQLLYLPFLQDPDPNAPVPPPRNLRAIFLGSSVNLAWDAVPSTTTGYGYKVYYDTDASGPPYNGTGATEGNSPIDVGNATQFTLSGLGGRVHVAVTAYDTRGRESWYSNEGSSPRRIYLPAVLKR